VRSEVLSFGTKSAVGTGKEKILGNESIERCNIGRELSGANVSFKGDDFGVVRPDKNGLKLGDVCARHARRIAALPVNRRGLRSQHVPHTLRAAAWCPKRLLPLTGLSLTLGTRKMLGGKKARYISQFCRC